MKISSQIYIYLDVYRVCERVPEVFLHVISTLFTDNFERVSDGNINLITTPFVVDKVHLVPDRLDFPSFVGRQTS